MWRRAILTMTRGYTYYGGVLDLMPHPSSRDTPSHATTLISPHRSSRSTHTPTLTRTHTRHTPHATRPSTPHTFEHTSSRGGPSSGERGARSLPDSAGPLAPHPPRTTPLHLHRPRRRQRGRRRRGRRCGRGAHGTAACARVATACQRTAARRAQEPLRGCPPPPSYMTQQIASSPHAASSAPLSKHAASSLNASRLDRRSRAGQLPRRRELPGHRQRGRGVLCLAAADRVPCHIGGVRC